MSASVPGLTAPRMQLGVRKKLFSGISLIFSGAIVAVAISVLGLSFPVNPIVIFLNRDAAFLRIFRCPFLKLVPQHHGSTGDQARTKFRKRLWREFASAKIPRPIRAASSPNHLTLRLGL